MRFEVDSRWLVPSR